MKRRSLSALVCAFVIACLGSSAQSACPPSVPTRKCNPPYKSGVTTTTTCDVACTAGAVCPNENVPTCIMWMDSVCFGAATTPCIMSLNPAQLPNTYGRCFRSSDCPNPEIEDKCYFTNEGGVECGFSFICVCSQGQ